MSTLSSALTWQAQRAAQMPPLFRQAGTTFEGRQGAVLLALCFALFLLMPAMALAAGPRDSAGVQITAGEAAPAAAIRKVIERQLAAFRRDDWAEAFSYAAPGIQRKFGTPDNFGTMVTQGYPAVYRHRSVHFGELRLLEGRPAQLVHFFGLDGRPVFFAYFMEQQPDGSWRIAGVRLLQVPESAV